MTKLKTMRKLSWILILLLVATFSGKLVTDIHSSGRDCSPKSIQKQTNSKPEEEALGTMMLLPVSFNLEAESK